MKAEDNDSTLTCVATIPGLKANSEYAILDVDCKFTADMIYHSILFQIEFLSRLIFRLILVVLSCFITLILSHPNLVYLAALYLMILMGGTVE